MTYSKWLADVAATMGTMTSSLVGMKGMRGLYNIGMQPEKAASKLLSQM